LKHTVQQLSQRQRAAVASERDQHCRGKATPEEPKLKARSTDPGTGSWGAGGNPPPHQLGGLGGAVRVLVQFGFFR